jgi:L-rhamnose mutarotase
MFNLPITTIMKLNKLSKTNKLYRLLPALIISFGLFLIAIPAHAQCPLYIVVEYLKVKPENHGKYIELERKIWEPMQQERINQHIIAGWLLYAVEFTGAADEYNYVAITLYSNPEQIENPWNIEILDKVHPGMDAEELMERTEKTCELIRSELYYSVAAAPKVPLKEPAPYMQVNFVKAARGKHSEYEMLEKDIWMPVHNESIRSGQTNGWGLWRAIFPRGEGRPYEYITLSTFSDYMYVFQLDFAIPFKAIHQDMDFGEIVQKTEEVRSTYRTELWDLIDYVLR